MKSMKMRSLACFGDSITGPGPGVSYREQYWKWSDFLQERLQTVVPTFDWKVWNYGKAGDTSWGLRSRVGEHLEESSPFGSIVLIGGNNFGPSSGVQNPLRQLEEDLREIVQRIRRSGSRILLVQYYEPRAENPEKVWVHLNRGNTVVQEVADDLNLPRLDLSSAFRKAAGILPLDQLLHPVDGVHLNPEGEKVLAAAVFERIDGLGWTSSPTV